MQIVLGGKLFLMANCFGGLFVFGGIFFQEAFFLDGFLTSGLWLGDFCPGAFCGVIEDHLYTDNASKQLYTVSVHQLPDAERRLNLVLDWGGIN